jgi:hypothetical protein
MSELGQKRKWADIRVKSAPPSIADIPNPTLCEFAPGITLTSVDNRYNLARRHKRHENAVDLILT